MLEAKWFRVVFVTAALAVGFFILGDEWSWHRHWLRHPWSSMGWLALVLVGVAAFVVLMAKHSWFSAPAAAALAVAVYHWHHQIFRGISWSDVGFLALVIASFLVVVMIVYAIVYHQPSSSRVRATRRMRFGAHLNAAYAKARRPASPAPDPYAS